MKTIDPEILKGLTPYEITELTKVMEAVEIQDYYASGLKYVSGGYVDTEIEDILYGEDYWEGETDEEFDLIQFWIILGEDDETCSRTETSHHVIPRRIINDKEMSIEDKIKTIKEA